MLVEFGPIHGNVKDLESELMEAVLVEPKQTMAHPFIFCPQWWLMVEFLSKHDTVDKAIKSAKIDFFYK